jgi:hypothetical protein
MKACKQAVACLRKEIAHQTWQACRRNQVHAPSITNSHFTLDVTLKEHRPFGEPMTGSLGKHKQMHSLLAGAVPELLVPQQHLSPARCLARNVRPLGGPI